MTAIIIAPLSRRPKWWKLWI